MQLGLRLPKDNTARAASIRQFALLAEEIGFDSLWSDAHAVVPVSVTTRYPLAELGRPTFGPRTPFPDAFVALGFAAGLTSRIRLGTAVVPLTSTHPLLLAKQAATLDALSGGRLELGVGAGWLLEEAAVLGHPTDHPSGRLAEAIGLMRAAWQDGTLEWHGRYYDIPAVGVYPTPPQAGEVPLWIGGHGAAAQRLAERCGAGVLLSRVAPSDVHERKRRAPATRIGVMLRLPGEADAWLPAAKAYCDAGTDVLILIAPDEGPRLVGDLQFLGASVLPHLR